MLMERFFLNTFSMFAHLYHKFPPKRLNYKERKFTTTYIGSLPLLIAQVQLVYLFIFMD
jgi:hypothetical protein